MDEETASSPTRSKVNGPRGAAKLSRSRATDESQSASKGHSRGLKSTHSFRNQNKLHVHIPSSQFDSNHAQQHSTENSRKAKTDPTPPLPHHLQPHLSEAGPRRAKSSPNPTNQGHQNGTKSVPTANPSPNPSPTVITTKTTDAAPSLAHKSVVSSITIASRKPQLSSFVSVPAQPQHLDPARQRMLDRAIKARLYFLRQSGPNKFLIGGDAVDSRFHVNIGPQTCSCNKAHCLHLLFVMLRVLKVKSSSPMLWAKQLRNYEVETLLGGFQTRVKRTAARKGSSKKFDFIKESEAVAKSSSVESAESSSSLLTTSGEVMENFNDISPALDSATPIEEGCTGESREEGEEGGDSDKEEDICPICLNELDEGEDLLVCRGCSNHLHQHCMDIWALEERRRNEPVHCPVCRSLWPYHMTSPSGKFALEGISMAGDRATSPLAKSSLAGSPVNVVIGKDKAELLEKVKELFGISGIDGLFSSDWKARETALSLISREAIALLLLQIRGNAASGSEVTATVVQSVCMEVVKYSCGDSVLKVFLASLELFKVVLGYSICHTADEALHLQHLIKPVLLFLLTRCADAQHRVRDCSIEATCNLCLGQEGAWSLGSACGQQTLYPVTNSRYVLQISFLGQEQENSWQWWMGRLTFMDRILSMFSVEYLLSQCVLEPPSAAAECSDSESDDPSLRSGIVSPSDSITSSAALSAVTDVSYMMELGPTSLDFEDAELAKNSVEDPLPVTCAAAIEKNLLMQVGYFAARATHVPHHKLGRLARKVIIKVSKVLRDDPSSLEVIHDVVGRCHRTQADGLLDRVLQARETAHKHRPFPDGLKKGEGSRSGSPQSFNNPPGSTREQKVSPSPLIKPPTPLASSSLKTSAEKARPREVNKVKVQSKVNGHKPKPSNSDGSTEQKAMAQDRGVSSSKTEGEEGSVRPLSREVSQEERRKLGRPKSRGGGGRGGGGAGERDDNVAEEYIPSDESFQSALSELEILDCSADTLMPPEEGFEGGPTEGEEGSTERGQFVGVSAEEEGGESSASNSHDSRVSLGSRKHTSSGSSIEKGVEPVGGFHNKPGYLNYPHTYARQSTAESASSDSLDVGWNCKRNIEEEEAEALAKVRSMVLEDIPHPALSGLVQPTPEVLIHVQANGTDKKNTEDTDDSAGGRPYVEGIHWVKGKLIGTGAFCSCYLARDMENGTMFAVKQVSYVRNTQAQEEEELARLRDEVAMLGRINHPNIVRCLGATQHQGHINIFIEWMAGGCLDQLLHDFGHFGENVICNYARQVTHGIVFLHENGIIHRDLKGGNILVDSTGRRLRIADFGAAARLATHTTGSGEFQNMEGTVAFMAPEVVRGGTDDSVGYGRKCDVWSIGCVLIQMATAKPPWAGTYDMKNKFQLIFKIGQATAPPPMPDFQNPGLKDFVIRCLEVRPEDRPSSLELLKHPLFTAA